MVPATLTALLGAQEGVVCRRQLLAAGVGDNDIARLLRRRELARVHAGVYVDHTGPLTPGQLRWAAVLWCTPAVLYGESALDAFGVRRTWRRDAQDRPPVVHVAIPHRRQARDLAGVRVHRMAGLDRLASWNLGPPRLRLEVAVLTACADAVTPHAALGIAAGGALSLLEHRYLVDVERAHGLPSADRQRRDSGGGGVVYRDARYDGFGVLVELDGRLGHEWTDDRADDMDRDLEAGASGELTLRIGWRQVTVTPCRTAHRLARTLQQRGWRGAARSCGPACSVIDGAA